MKKNLGSTKGFKFAQSCDSRECRGKYKDQSNN